VAGPRRKDCSIRRRIRSRGQARRGRTPADKYSGIGALNATALVAAVGDAETFARGRNLAAWLRLVPRQVTTGGKPRLLGITKRGSKYLRKMLIQGARAALPTLSRSNTRLGQWLRSLLARAHSNTVVVALAAKMARIVWALLRYGTTFEPRAIAI
jgi:transposase